MTSAYGEAIHILIEAAARLGRTSEQIFSFIKKFQENWIESKEDIQKLKTDDWKYMGVPIRLVNEILTICQDSTVQLGTRGEILHTGNEKGKSTENDNAQPVASELSSGTPAYDTVSYEFPSHLEDHAAAVTLLLKNVKNSSVLSDLLKILLQIVDNILVNPADSKKRILKKANKKLSSTVLTESAAINILRSLGFEMNDDLIYMPVAYVLHLEEARHSLVQACESLNLNVPPKPQSLIFNPYQTNVNYTGLSALTPQQRELHNVQKKNLVDGWDITEINRQIHEIKRLHTIGCESETIDLAPKVFHISEVYTIRPEKVGVDDDDSSIDLPNISSEELARLKQSFSANATFKSRLLEEFRVLKKKKVFKKCVLRILMPTDWVLQVEFASGTKLAKVKELVQPMLDPEIMNWELFQSPVMKVFDLNKTLLQENLCPNSIVRLRVLGSVGETLYIAKQLLPANYHQKEEEVKREKERIEKECEEKKKRNIEKELKALEKYKMHQKQKKNITNPDLNSNTNKSEDSEENYA